MVEYPIRMHSDNIVTACIYSGLKPGLPRIAVCKWNVTVKPITLPAKPIIGKITASDIILSM